MRSQAGDVKNNANANGNSYTAFFLLVLNPTFSSKTNWHSLVCNGCKMRLALTLLRIKKGLQSPFSWAAVSTCEKNFEHGIFIITTVLLSLRFNKVWMFRG